MVKAIIQRTVPLKELLECGWNKKVKELKKLQRSSLKALQKTKEAIEQLIVKAVHQYEVLL